MERRELLERLAPLIPPPRAHPVRYHGILAPCASGRDRVVPGRDAKESTQHATKDAPLPLAAHPTTRIDGPIDGRDAPPPHGSDLVPLPTSGVLQPRSIEPGPVSADAGTRPLAIVKPAVPPPRRAAWAELLQRVFEVDALRCPACSGRMRILAAAYDEVLGIVQSLSGGAGMTGTLTVKYRSPTPLHTPLLFEARLDRVEGRKIFTSAHLEANGTLCAEAEGIFISFKQDQMARLAKMRADREADLDQSGEDQSQ